MGSINNKNSKVKNYSDKEESKNMNSLKRMISDYIKGRDTTIKVVILRGFAKELDKVIIEEE